MASVMCVCMAPLWNLGGWPRCLCGFGDTLVPHPVLEVRDRQMRWMLLGCNMPGLVGVVHRAVAWTGSQWQSPVRRFGWR